PYEDSAIPVVPARREKLRRQLHGGLFANRSNSGDWNALPPRQLDAALHVAVTGGGEGGADAERDQGAGMLEHHLLGDEGGAAEFLGRLDDVIRRHHQHDAFGIVPSDKCRSQTDTRGRIAPAWLADDALRRQARQLAGGLGAVARAGDDPCPRRREWHLEPLQRLLPERGSADQRQEKTWLLTAARGAK